MIAGTYSKYVKDQYGDDNEFVYFRLGWGDFQTSEPCFA